MIEKTQAYKTSDEKTFENLALAQEHELELLIQSTMGNESASLVCKKLVEESARVLDILQTRANSRPKARTINGATRKKRTPKADAATAASLTLK